MPIFNYPIEVLKRARRSEWEFQDKTLREIRTFVDGAPRKRALQVSEQATRKRIYRLTRAIDLLSAENNEQ